MQGKTAVVTGASSGIGRACAELLQKEGMQVINADKIAPNASTKVQYVPCDVTIKKDIDHLYKQAKRSFGVPDVLISNAGVGIHEKLYEGDPVKWQTVIDTNLMGPLRFIRSFVPEMLNRKKGHIIFISSVAARKPHPYGGVYAASKSALEVVAETLRLEVQPHLKVSVVSPGVIESSFFENTIGGPRHSDFGWAKVTPEHVASHIRYLLSLPDEVNLDQTIIRPSDQSF